MLVFEGFFLLLLLLLLEGGGGVILRDKDKLSLSSLYYFDKFYKAVQKLSFQFTNKFTENMLAQANKSSFNL